MAKGDSGRNTQLFVSLQRRRSKRIYYTRGRHRSSTRGYIYSVWKSEVYLCIGVKRAREKSHAADGERNKSYERASTGYRVRRTAIRVYIRYYMARYFFFRPASGSRPWDVIFMLLTTALLPSKKTELNWVVRYGWLLRIFLDFCSCEIDQQAAVLYSI